MIITAVMLVGVAKVEAQETVCIAIYPCLDNGEIDPRFDVVGECGDQWRMQCDKVRADLLTDKFNSCQEQNALLQEQTEKLSTEQKKLQKTLRKLKRAQARS